MRPRRPGILSSASVYGTQPTDLHPLHYWRDLVLSTGSAAMPPNYFIYPLCGTGQMAADRSARPRSVTANYPRLNSGMFAARFIDAGQFVFALSDKLIPQR